MSLRARVVSTILRHTLKRTLAGSENVAVLRGAMSGGLYRVPGDVAVEDGAVAGVSGEWVRPRSGVRRGTLLYLHGGGYFACSPRTHRPYSCYFARCGWQVFVPDYRRAPEAPFPAAVEDAQAVLAELSRETDVSSRLVVAGDSAGGGLALALMVAERDAGRPLPAAAALFSPWTDLAVTGDSIRENERHCAMFTGDMIRRGAELYLNGADPGNPLASPLYADLSGLPPLLVHASEHETLRDDSVRLAERAQACGVPAALRLWPRVPHVWQLFYPLVPEGRESLAQAAGFLEARLGLERPELSRAMGRAEAG